MEYKQLVQILVENSDKKFDEFNNKIINSGVRTIGCTVPFVRQIAKKTTLAEALSYPSHEYFEVDLLKGIVVSSAKLHSEEKKQLLSDFADSIENWAVCDCSTVKVVKNEMNDYFEYFCALCLSSKPFAARYGIVNLLANYLTDEYVDKIFAKFKEITTFGNYYVDMAVAWLVATAIVKCRMQTVAYMEGEGKSVLNKFTYNKALQKMRDSFRVSAEDKAWSKTMKL